MEDDFDIEVGGLSSGINTAVALWCTDPVVAKAQYGPIASWDTSGVTCMLWLFWGRADFDEDVSRWDVSSVRTMTGMFSGASSFTADVSGWDVSSVKDIGYMFYDAASFNVDLSSWDVSSVVNMGCMLSGAASFTHQLAGAWPTSTACKHLMFFGCPGGSVAGRTNGADGTPV